MMTFTLPISFVELTVMSFVPVLSAFTSVSLTSTIALVLYPWSFSFTAPVACAMISSLFGDVR